MQNDYIIIENAAQLFTYDPETGAVRWAVDRGRCKRIRAGAKAGHTRKDGYTEIRLGKRPFMAHRVAWFLHHGELPPCQLDHINRDRSDNRICNLRIASENAFHNNQNRRVGKNNTSGAIGVMWYPTKNKWIARIKVKGRSIYLGLFSNFDDAVLARKAAELKYFTFANS